MLVERSGARGVLQDGALRVPLPAGRRFLSWGRVECGWLGWMVTGGPVSELGVLQTAGRFRSFGAVAWGEAALSPDDRQVAFVRGASDGGRLVVLDVATGRQVASTPAPRNSAVLGWNGHGVWFSPPSRGRQTRLWRPGAEPVTIDTGGARLTAWRTHDRMLLTGDQPGQQALGCLRVVTLGEGDKLTEVMRQCLAPEGSLSPDGLVLVVGANAFTVPDNSSDGVNRDRRRSIPRLSWAPAFGATHETIWEDERHLLPRPAWARPFRDHALRRGRR